LAVWLHFFLLQWQSDWGSSYLRRVLVFIPVVFLVKKSWEIKLMILLIQFRTFCNQTTMICCSKTMQGWCNFLSETSDSIDNPFSISSVCEHKSGSLVSLKPCLVRWITNYQDALFTGIPGLKTGTAGAYRFF
jgi:hypothetical protein